MTRVLVLPKWYPWPDRPVFGLFCREHARAAALHNDVRVLAFTPERMKGLYRIWDDPSEPVPTTRLVYKRPLLRPAAMVTQLLGMRAALRRTDWRPEIIHAHVFEAGFPAVLLGRQLGVPVVVSEHFTAFQRGLVRGLDLRLARYTFGHADLVCPVSEDLRAQLERVQPRGRYRVVGNVVDPAIFFPPAGPRAPGPLRLFNVASLDEKKRHVDLLEAFAALTIDATLEIAGEGELDEKLQRRAHVLGVADRVTFLGGQSQAQVAERMRAADVFVLSSRFENLPVVLLEASATGLPIVATRVGGVPEIVGEDGGALVEPLQPASLARAIEAVAARTFDREALAARARSRWGIEAIGAVWDEIYASLSAGSTRS